MDTRQSRLDAEAAHRELFSRLMVSIEPHFAFSAQRVTKQYQLHTDP
jgi:hypothetical protein